MKILTTSVAALATAMLFAGTAVSAADCDFHKQQVTAQSTTAPAEETTTATSTPVDPKLLAQLEKSKTTDERLPEAE